jgi:hypothetical protein
MKIKMIAALSIATAAALPLAATAHACGGSVDPAYLSHTFQSPSGNIACDYQVGYRDDPNKGYVSCEVRDHTWVAPRAPVCAGYDGDELSMIGEASQPSWGCFSGVGPLGESDKSTLDYGQTLSVGPITCDSEPSGVTCTGSNTGHFFRVSRESYEVG